MPPIARSRFIVCLALSLTFAPAVPSWSQESTAKTVDGLVREAHSVFRSRQKNNLDKTAALLSKAFQLAPYRTDLLFAIATTHVFKRDIDGALGVYREIAQKNPTNIDVYSLLAVWTHFQGDAARSKTHLRRLKKLNKNRASDIRATLKVIDRVLQTPLKNSDSVDLGQNDAIILLGFSLKADGSMKPTLVERLKKTLHLAEKYPKARIIVTGGVAKSDVTEARKMADWLLERGVRKDRISEENYAWDTVSNSDLSFPILSVHGVKKATLISSCSHVRRAQVIFEIEKWRYGPQDIVFDSVCSDGDKVMAALKEPSKTERAKVYRDALRAFGFWSFDSKPFIFR